MLIEKEKIKIQSKKKITNKSMYFIAGLLFAISKVNFIFSLLLVVIYLSVNIVQLGKIPVTRKIIPLVFIFMIGLTTTLFHLNTLRGTNILKDVLYFLRPGILMYFGYFIGWKNRKIMDFKYIIFKVVIIYSTLSVLYNLTNILLNLEYISHDFSFLKIREVMGKSDDLAVVGFFILMIYPLFTDRKIFSRKTTNIFIVIFFAYFITTFSRTTLLTLLLCFAIYLLFTKKIKIKTVVFLPLFAILPFFLSKFLLKSSAFNSFFIKIKNTFTELNSNLDWNDYRNIVLNWRGYEVFTAKEQLRMFSPLAKIFGHGFGTLIPVQYSDLVGVPLTEGGIILLHNGYYTLLIKVGLAGVALYLIFILVLLLTAKKNYPIKKLESIILFCIGVIIFINTFTTTGIFKSIYSFGMLILIGYLLWEEEKVSVQKN